MNSTPGVNADSGYVSFTSMLTQQFLSGGAPRLKVIEAWYNDVNLKAIRFNFTNGRCEIQTEVFGLQTQTNLNRTVVNVDPKVNVTSTQLTFLNSVQPLSQLDGSKWGIINFGINGNQKVLQRDSSVSTS